MLDVVYRYNPREEEIRKIDKFIVIMSTVMLFIIPLLVYRHDSISFSPLLESTYGTGQKVDVFNYFKSITIILGMCSLLWALLYKMIKHEYKLKNSILNYFLIIFATFIVISPLFSKYKDIALLGNFDRYEGAVAWFSYISIFFVLFNTKIEQKYFKFIYLALVPFIIINLFISITNLIGFNLIEVDFINNMLGGGLSGYFVTTLYHPNFGSAISSVIFSISFMYLLLEENIKVKIFLMITTVMSFAMLLGMISSGGFMTILVVVPILLVIAIRLTNIKNVLTWGGLTIILNTVVYFIMNNLNEKVYAESFSLIAKINSVSKILIPLAIILFLGIVFSFKFINRKKEFDIITILAVVVVSGGLLFISSKIEKEKTILEENPNAEIVRIKDSSLYQKINEMSTDRINIWMKTIDLINDKPLVGHGFDTLPYIISQVDEDKGISTYGEFIDKPHNWYLTVAYGCGVIGLAGLVAILIYITRALFNSVSEKINNKYLYIFGIGVIAYAISGFTNDSLGGTSVIFWIIAGVCASQLKGDNIENKCNNSN
jgi:hypothetical protein